jgi:ribosome maturation factor RimP
LNRLPRLFLSHADAVAQQTHPREVRKGIAERVRSLAEEVLAPTDHFLVDVEVRGHHGTRVIEVYVDSLEDPGLDDLAEVSKEIDFLMDMEDTVDGSHKLEISSPGAKRPLTDPRQFQKNAGREMRVKYRDEGEKKRAEGELTEATDDDFELTEPSGHALRIAYGDVEEAKLKLPW